MKLSVKHYFDASHQLPDTKYLVTKACARLHGHTYAVKIDIESNELKGGMVIDFKAIKTIVDELDHRHINNVFDEVGYNKPPSAENIARYISKRIVEDTGFHNTIAICEGYKGEDRASWAIYHSKEVMKDEASSSKQRT